MSSAMQNVQETAQEALGTDQEWRPRDRTALRLIVAALVLGGLTIGTIVFGLVATPVVIGGGLLALLTSPIWGTLLFVTSPLWLPIVLLGGGALLITPPALGAIAVAIGATTVGAWWFWSFITSKGAREIPGEVVDATKEATWKVKHGLQSTAQTAAERMPGRHTGAAAS